MKTTPEFDTIMMDNPSIWKSFEEQFIVGMNYDFVYDNSIKKQPNGYYFQAGVGTSGNLLDLVHRVSSGETNRPYSFVGNIYSQVIKLSADTRYYRNYKTFIDQLAMGTGAGLRFDFGFFVLRTDLGLPLRTAYVRENGSNWMVRSGDVFRKAVFNLAIGYPF